MIGWNKSITKNHSSYKPKMGWFRLVFIYKLNDMQLSMIGSPFLHTNFRLRWIICTHLVLKYLSEDFSNWDTDDGQILSIFLTHRSKVDHLSLKYVMCLTIKQLAVCCRRSCYTANTNQNVCCSVGRLIVYGFTFMYPAHRNYLAQLVNCQQNWIYAVYTCGK